MSVRVERNSGAFHDRGSELNIEPSISLMHSDNIQKPGLIRFHRVDRTSTSCPTSWSQPREQRCQHVLL